MSRWHAKTFVGYARCAKFETRRLMPGIILRPDCPAAQGIEFTIIILLPNRDDPTSNPPVIGDRASISLPKSLGNLQHIVIEAESRFIHSSKPPPSEQTAIMKKSRRSDEVQQRRFPNVLISQPVILCDPGAAVGLIAISKPYPEPIEDPAEALPRQTHILGSQYQYAQQNIREQTGDGRLCCAAI